MLCSLLLLLLIFFLGRERAIAADGRRYVHRSSHDLTSQEHAIPASDYC